MLQILREFDADDNGVADVDEALIVDVTDSRHLLLKKVCAEHCLIDLRFAHGPEAFQTAILELVPEAGYMVLDALVPAEGDESTVDVPTVNIRTRVHGMDLNFQSVITQRGVVDGAPFYKIPYPETIDYPQRRGEHRVTVPLDRGVEVRVHAHDDSIVTGEVRDLSPSGFSARIHSGDLSVFDAQEARATACEIDLPRYGTITAAIEICHVFPRQGRAVPRIGVCFVDLDPRTERQIEHSVARLDREQSRLR